MMEVLGMGNLGLMVSAPPIQTALQGVNCNAEQLMPWLVRSRAELGELKGFGELFRGREQLLQTHLLMDAVENCILDQIQVTREAALEGQLFNEAEQMPGVRSVMHYREALQMGMDLISNGPLTTEGLLAIHAVLCGAAVSGKSKKSIQGINLEGGESMDQILHFANRDEKHLDPLARCIVAYGLFEVIRPFPDCNEGLSRIFLTLLLVQAGLLRFPVIGINGYLRRSSENIQRLLNDPGLLSNWSPFVKYMMHGFSIQAKETRESLEKMLQCYGQTDQGIREKCPEIYTPELVFMLHALPVISPLRLSSRLDIHYTTATRYLKRLESEGFLQNRQSGKYQLYINRQLMDLLVKQ